MPQCPGESRARVSSTCYRLVIDEHNRLVAEEPLLLPPLIGGSLAVWLVDRCSHGGTRYARRAKAACWTNGVLASIGHPSCLCGDGVWVVSAVSAPFKWQDPTLARWVPPPPEKEFAGSGSLRYVVIFMWCAVGAPMYIPFASFWLTAPLKWIRPRPWGCLGNQHNKLPGSF